MNLTKLFNRVKKDKIVYEVSEKQNKYSFLSSLFKDSNYYQKDSDKLIEYNINNLENKISKNDFISVKSNRIYLETFFLLYTEFGKISKKDFIDLIFNEHYFFRFHYIISWNIYFKEDEITKQDYIDIKTSDKSGSSLLEIYDIIEWNKKQIEIDNEAKDLFSKEEYLNINISDKICCASIDQWNKAMGEICGYINGEIHEKYLYNEENQSLAMINFNRYCDFEDRYSKNHILLTYPYSMDMIEWNKNHKDQCYFNDGLRGGVYAFERITFEEFMQSIPNDEEIRLFKLEQRDFERKINKNKAI
jgi:hypothetical protein